MLFSVTTYLGHTEGSCAKGSTALGLSLLCACQGAEMVPVSPRKVVQYDLAARCLGMLAYLEPVYF